MPPIDQNANRQAPKRKRYGAVGRGADTITPPASKNVVTAKERVKPSSPARVTVRPPDRADERQAARDAQLTRSRPLAGDAPQRRAADFKRAEDYVRGLYQREAAARIVRPAGREVVRYRQGTTVPPDVAQSVAWSRVRTQAKAQQAARVAPVLTVLEQTTRPIHGVAAGTRAAIHGQNPVPAAWKGVKLEDKSLMSDVLKDLGIGGPAASIGGFVLDVLADPTTYITGGTASVARSAGAKAAARVEKKALASGLDEGQAQRLAGFARAQAEKRAGTGRRVDVRFAGRSVPGVTRATAAAGGRVSGAANRVRPVRATRDALRHLAADFNPNIVPDGMTRVQYNAVRQATRTARSSASREIHKVRIRAGAVSKAIGDANYRTVLDAIESGTVRSLPPELKAPARFLQDQFKYARRVEKQAGIPGATRRNYVPHLHTDLAEEGAGMGAQSVGARRIVPSSSRARKDDRTLAEIRQSDPGKYVEDPGVLFAARLSESASARARAELNRRLAGMGRRVPQNRAVSLEHGESVYHVKGSDIRELDLSKQADRAELQSYVDGSGRKGGQYVALNAQAVNRALKTITPGGERSATGHALDQLQGAWKFAATQPNPGFHLRNFVGDAQNAFLAQSAPRLTLNLGHAARALTELGRQERALRTLNRRIDPRGKGVKIDGKRMSYAHLIAEAEKVGGIRAGFVSRELHDLMDGRAAQKVGGRGAAMRRWLANREDVVRLATYIGSRQRGLGAEQAAARVARFHFDYSDLTELERRVMRRIMPFYTFSARNIPLQFKSLVSRPGKYAQYEKIREEVARAFGYEDNWEGDLSEGEQRAAPIGIRIGGKPYTISLGPSGLPLTDLSEFPTGANPVKQADEWIDRAMSLVTPGIKTPVELWANMSFFFREPLERDDAPLVPVSTLIVKTVPKGLRAKLGFTPDYVDKRTGKKQWAAPARLVYALGVLPGPASFLNRVTTPSERAGQDAKSKTVGYLGVRVRPVDKVSTQINRLYKDREKVDKRMRTLNQQGINAGNATDEYRRLAMSEKDITSHIMALRTKRGDKIIPGGRTRVLGPSAAGGEKIDAADAADIRRSMQESRIDPMDLEEIRRQVAGG